MTPPSIKGHTIEELIGSGSAGSVYEAKRDDGTRVAIKVFESMASNPALIRSRMERVMDGGAQNVTVPIIAEALDVRPACVVMPLLAEIHEDGGRRFVPNTLQTRLAEYMGTEKAWPLVEALANRLATLHGVRVAHGNLKPGNIFLDGDRPLLADYASGLMPGVHHLAFSDALLYAPPEQLNNPEGYLNEEGYGWDVYAFGVLAFRLLTGQFPRCQGIFESVCPAAGADSRHGIEASYEGIAAGLAEDPRLPWPADPVDEREARRREMIEFCLMLDPQGRPVDMRGVARRFEKIDAELEAEAIQQDLTKKRKVAERRRAVANGITKILGLIILGLAAGWGWTQYQRTNEATAAANDFGDYRAVSEETIAGLESSLDEAQASEKMSLSKASRLQAALDQEQKKAEDELRSAQMTNDKLFDWILESGVAGLPALENRQGRLAYLDERISEQLEGMETRAALAKQAARLRLRKAEVLLAAGRADEGLNALKDALAVGGSHLEAVDEARARLRYLVLVSEGMKASISDEIGKTGLVVAEAWPTGSSERMRAEAALSFVKGRESEFKKDFPAALKHYKSSLQRLNALVELFPETPALRMNLGRGYLRAALAAEGGGAVDDAAALRAQAAASFSELAKRSKEAIPEIDFQIAAANASRAIAEWQMGKTFSAEKLAKSALDELTGLVSKMPNDFRLTRAIASQQGIIASVMRDEGRTTASGELLNRAIKNLETGIDTHPQDWSAKYLLASLKWQLSGLVGQQGKSGEEIKLGTEARDLLKLILDAAVPIPHPTTVRKSQAYLCGDLGHSADLAGKRELGVAFLKESKSCWDSLQKEDPNDDEAKEGLAWVNQRLSELGVR
ncbi:MAG: serine/threonine protein kinase [Verrucomicrobiaceae bacterium]